MGFIRTDLRQQNSHPANPIAALKLVGAITLETFLRLAVSQASFSVYFVLGGDLLDGELIRGCGTGVYGSFGLG